MDTERVWPPTIPLLERARTFVVIAERPLWPPLEGTVHAATMSRIFLIGSQRGVDPACSPGNAS